MTSRGPSEVLTLSSMFCGHVNLGTAVTMFLWNAERGATAVSVAFVACVIPYAAVEWSDHRKRRSRSRYHAQKPSRGNALPVDNAAVLAINT